MPFFSVSGSLNGPRASHAPTYPSEPSTTPTPSSGAIDATGAESSGSIGADVFDDALDDGDALATTPALGADDSFDAVDRAGSSSGAGPTHAEAQASPTTIDENPARIARRFQRSRERGNFP